MDRYEAGQNGEDPDCGVELPDKSNADGVVVAERLAYGEVAVEADGEQIVTQDEKMRKVKMIWKKRTGVDVQQVLVNP